MKITAKAEARFRSSVIIGKRESDCWDWSGYIDDKNRARFNLERKNIPASRVAFEILRSPIPSGLHVLHTCDNGRCVNPAHLFLGTNLDNVKDMCKKGRHANMVKTHCPRGHSYSPDNIYFNKYGERTCKTCKRLRYKGII